MPAKPKRTKTPQGGTTPHVPVVNLDDKDYKEQIVQDPKQFLQGEALPNSDTIDKSTIAVASLKRFTRHSNWFELYGYTIRFVKVSPMLIQRAKADIVTRLNRTKPHPQEFIKRGEKTELDGSNNPAYKEALEIWQDAWNSAELDVNTNIAALAGVEISGGVPPVEMWLDDVRFMFNAIGSDLDKLIEANTAFKRDTFIELLFKKFVILADPEITIIFRNFQEGKLDERFESSEPLDPSAFFRPNAGRAIP